MERRDDGADATGRARELRRRATAWEIALFRRLRSGENRWRRSHPLGGFYLDLYCDAARLAIECDVARHDPGYDAWRDAKLAELGVRVLRLTNVAIGTDVEGSVRAIRAVEIERAARFRQG